VIEERRGGGGRPLAKKNTPVVWHRIGTNTDEELSCACGKYRTKRFAGIICERCGFELFPGGSSNISFVVQLTYDGVSELLEYVRSWSKDERRTATSRKRAGAFASAISKGVHDAKATAKA
jgi:hypothetical protein